MSITSFAFLLFMAVVLLAYYAVPKRMQWWILLAASLFFYLQCGAKNIIYVLVASAVVYGAALGMQALSTQQKEYLKVHKAELSKEEKTAYKTRQKSKRKLLLILALSVNLGLLCIFKYFHFALEQVNAVICLTGGAPIRDTFRFIAPLGISFYTFQSVGYLADVYWDHYPAERNFGKMLLFISFFPQVTQGPISSFDTMSAELFTEHSFSYRSYAWGAQRALWGFFKKMVVANVLSVYVDRVFLNYMHYSAPAVLFGMVCYSVQIYADFSGYMDIMCGFCRMLGICLPENFDRPYFSKSVAEYWRRWHISLGAWFKKYIYYPIGMSSWSRKLAKLCSAKLGKYFADTIPATLALIVVWFATGLWHGASWAYILWGGVNGLFIILTLWLEPLYGKCRSFLHIREESLLWQGFRILRTFILVTFIKVLPEVGTLHDGLNLWKHALFNSNAPTAFAELILFPGGTYVVSLGMFVLAFLGTVLIFVFSVMQNKGPVRERFNRLPFLGRMIVLSTAMFLIAVFGVWITYTTGKEGFMYAQF